MPERSSRLFAAAPFPAFGAHGVISVIRPILTPYPLPTAPIADFLGGGLLFGRAGAPAALAAPDASSRYPALGAGRSIGFAAFAEPTLLGAYFGVAALPGTDSPCTTNRLLSGPAAAYLGPAHLLLLAAFCLLVLLGTGKLPVGSRGRNELSMVEEGRIFEVLRAASRSLALERVVAAVPPLSGPPHCLRGPVGFPRRPHPARRRDGPRLPPREDAAPRGSPPPPGGVPYEGDALPLRRGVGAEGPDRGDRRRFAGSVRARPSGGRVGSLRAPAASAPEARARPRGRAAPELGCRRRLLL